MTQKEKLARLFSSYLVAEIGKFKICRVNILNKKEIKANTGICHSHDFTDANEIMLAAKEDLDLQFKSQEKEWEFLSGAWGLAKQNLFYLGD
jgi:hypothetical protein